MYTLKQKNFWWGRIQQKWGLEKGGGLKVGGQKYVFYISFEKLNSGIPKS